MTPAARAAVPTWSVLSPVTASSPAGPGETVTPGPRSAAARASGLAARTRTSGWPACAMKSAMLVSAMSRPRPMTIRCSAVTAISFIRCEDTKTVRPSAARLRSSDRTQRMPSVSRPLSGSSRMTVRGSPSRAVAMLSRWPMPRENRPARRRPASRRPTAAITSSTRDLRMPLVWAMASRWW